MVKSYKKLRTSRINVGLCGACGKNPLKSETMCENCLSKMRARSQKKKESGLCVACRKPVLNKVVCDECNVKRKAYRDARKLNGMCHECGKNPVLTSRTKCIGCLEKQKRQFRERKDKVYEAYGGYICNCCGETESSFLSVDHINNDGYKMRQDVHKQNLYLWLIKNNFPSGFQILCMNCQFGRKFNNGTCPHQRKAGGNP